MGHTELLIQDASGAMRDRVCLVTGATSGIGLVTARELARRGATVVGVGRDPDRCREAADAIRRETGSAAVDYLRADLSSQGEVRDLARAFSSRHARLHVLVNNAGALFALRRESVDGVEMTLAVNHLAPFLLTTLLLDVLGRSAPSRVVNVTSAAHADVAGFDFEDPQAAKSRRWPGRYPRSELASLLYALALPWAHPGFLQYARTKLANLLFTAELARRLAGSGVTVNALHPGLVASGFGAGNGTYGWFMNRFIRARGTGVEEGARTTLHLATSPDVTDLSGRYFVDMRLAESTAAARDPDAARRLWELSEEMVRSPASLRSGQPSANG